MTRRWIGPVIVALLVAMASYYLALVATPRVLMAGAMRRIGNDAQVNHMVQVPLANAESRTVVRPSPDLAYSACAFDLSAGPLRLDVPVIPAVYWSLSAFDARTNNAFVRNNREAGNAPMSVVLALPGQPVPKGVETVRLDTAKGIALVRILVADRAEFPAIDAARHRSSCKTLN
ncbi:MAG: DUF1254 domain-containing protein [Sphingomonas bacterium]|nr:DUF1254 domain-containing protein [Sphingomonas bacterium]